MKRMALALVLSVVCLLSPGCRKADPGQGQGPGPTPAPDVPSGVDPSRLTSDQKAEARRTIIAWLECEECTEGQLEAVVKLGAAAVPSLAASLREGPSQASREVYRRNLAATYRELKDYERTHPEAHVTMSEEEYVRTYMENYVALHQTRSATALGAIGGPEARRALEEASRAQFRDDVMHAVQTSLGKMR
jgi:hypothetical protein